MFQTDYESQISEVSNGKQMSELSHINIPSPPPLPDSVSRFFKNWARAWQNKQKYSSVFRENRCPPLPKQSVVAISVMKLWPWKLCQGHQNLISYLSFPIYIGLQIYIIFGNIPSNGRSVRVAERLALPISVHGVASLNPAGGEILPKLKRHFIAQSLSCSPFHRLEMSEILLKGRKTLTHPSIQWSMS